MLLIQFHFIVRQARFENPPFPAKLSFSTAMEEDSSRGE